MPLCYIVATKFAETQGRHGGLPLRNILNKMKKMDNQETVQAAIDSLRQDVEGLKTLLHLKDTKMEFLLANLAKTETALAVAEQRMDDLLLGSIATFAVPEPPEGWLVCDGQEVSRQSYALLFAKIGTTFGEGDGEETFNLPDLRGVFVRGWDEERKFGSHQDDQMQGHTHKDGGHSHQGSTSSDGSHKHNGKSDTDGNHRHTGNVIENGNHYHPLKERDGDNFTATGFFKNYQGDKEKPKQCVLASLPLSGIEAGWWKWDDVYSGNITSTDSRGSHTHALSIDATGNHYHNLEINSAGSHSHSFSTTSAAANLGLPSALSHGSPRFGDETRPTNVALLFCIKY